MITFVSMTRVSKIKVRRDLASSEYVNTGTGEGLSDELGKSAKASIFKDTDLSSLSYSNYATVNYDCVFTLPDVLNYCDIGRILMLSGIAETTRNILMNGSIAHTNKTLREFLGFGSTSKYDEFINRLIEVGVLARERGVVSGRMRYIYYFNPHISKRGRVFNREVLEIFDKFRTFKKISHGKR